MIAIAPQAFGTEDELLEWMTRPSPALVEFIPRLKSPLVLLGAGGKMGPTLAVLAKRAAREAGVKLNVVAVSRFSDASLPAWLKSQGVQPESADLLDRAAYRRLPDSRNVLYLVGLKFGTDRDPSATWAVNTVVPTLASERYPEARWSILSTGNVYPLTEIGSGGAKEDHPLTPLGEYPNAAVARERVFEFFSRRGEQPMVALRLSYAIDLRYGVLTDLAGKIQRQDPIDVTNGYFNCIWQGDANEMVIRALGLAESPLRAINLTGPGTYRVRDVAESLGKVMGLAPIIHGQETSTALLSNVDLMRRQLGEPATSMDRMIGWVGQWVGGGGRTYNRPTHFEVRDGRY